MTEMSLKTTFCCADMLMPICECILYPGVKGCISRKLRVLCKDFARRVYLLLLQISV